MWSFSEKKYYLNQIKYWGILLLFLIIWVSLLLFSIKNARWDIQAIVSIIYFLLGFICYPLLKRLLNYSEQFTDKILIEIDKAKKGKIGEELVFNELNRILNSNEYFILKNYKVPGKKFDLDFIVIGPKGVIILEVKNYSNELFFTKDKVYFLSKDKKDIILIPEEKDPRHLTKSHSYFFEKQLNLLGYSDIKPKLAIIFIKENLVHIKTDEIGVYLINGLNLLSNFLSGVYVDKRFDKEFSINLTNKLNNNI